MRNKEILARVLQGTARTELLYVPELESDGCGGLDPDGNPLEDCDGVVTVRPLTQIEDAEVTAAETAGQVIRGDLNSAPTEQEIRVSETAKGQAEAERIAAAYGLSVDGVKVTPGQVGKLHPAAVRRIAAKVREMSGGGLTEAARQFRGDAGRGDHRGPAPDGSTDRADAS